MNNSIRYRSEVAERLNFKPTQHPPDLYYIKAEKDRLNYYLKNIELMNNNVERATPRYTHRVSLFQLQQTDYDKIVNSEKEARIRYISPKDSFVHLGTDPEIYQPLHAGVLAT